jgi:hypothetical protein
MHARSVDVTDFSGLSHVTWRVSQTQVTTPTNGTPMAPGKRQSRLKTVPSLEEAAYTLTYYIRYGTRPEQVVVSPADSVAELIKKVNAIEKVDESALFWRCANILMHSLT